MSEAANQDCLPEKSSKSVVASPNDTTRPFDVFSYYPKKNISWNSEMTVNLKARSKGRQVTDHAPHSAAVCEYDSPRLLGLYPFGSSLF
jgi:hypothetical protein